MLRIATEKRMMSPASKGCKRAKHSGGQTSSNQHATMGWAKRLKPVFDPDVTSFATYGSRVKVIASIEDSEIIKHFLSHIQIKEEAHKANLQPQSRAPPQLNLFD